ncbi:tripartite motif containing 22 [Rhinolophus ferrumequinum]|uniref:Tripartite motif containing 22 n=1 Tax=Rhinolophus ferrumequinum TaxID=59479 RepID=A0A7J7WB80_RHIFE|nr:tripartite motif containing 22 [Rhinolophus ferrumequinum]
MASGILLHIQEELTCPICLELLTEPLSLDCGHSFCKACITANNKEPEISQKGKSLCPVCRFSYHPGDLRPNRFVANIVERLREVKVSPEEGQKRDLCVRHGEKLHLFCKEDGKVICWLCERSQEHRDHHTFLIEEVAQEYQEKLEAALERLKTEQKKAEMYNSNIRKEEAYWKNQIQHDIQSFQNCIKQLKDVLDSEEQKELQKLKNEEGHILHTLAESEKKLVRQSQLVGDLISALEHRLQGSAIEMLQDVNGIMERSESWTWKKPKIVSTKLKSAFQAPDLSRILQEFKELTEVQSYWVDFMLNPVNALSGVVVSADHRQVTVGNSFMFRNVYPCNFSAFDVLGCQNFSSGKYYWEVDVSQKIAWILGVYSNTSDLNRKRSSGFVFNPHINYLNVYYRFRPDNGYWVVGLQNESEYNAFEDSSTSDPKVLTLSMAVPPCRVGVFLDYEAGTVSFFNVTNHGSLIYKFSKCRFSQAAYPYFNPWNCPSPMTLCQPNS